MDENGYDFVIMIKGMKSLVSELVLQVQGGFENDRKNSIRAYSLDSRKRDDEILVMNSEKP